jgi:hypothetical protein
LAEQLPADRYAAAMDAIRTWRFDPNAEIACPVCESAGLCITDQSARPYAEWYLLTCSRCGLEAKLNIPLAGPQSS